MKANIQGIGVSATDMKKYKFNYAVAEFQYAPVSKLDRFKYFVLRRILPSQIIFDYDVERFRKRCDDIVKKKSR